MGARDDPEKLPQPHPHVRVLGTRPVEVSVVAEPAFSSPGTAAGEAGAAERDAVLEGAVPMSTRHRHAVADLPGEGVPAVGTAQRAGDVVEIARVYERVGFRRFGTARIASPAG